MEKLAGRLKLCEVGDVTAAHEESTARHGREQDDWERHTNEKMSHYEVLFNGYGKYDGMFRVLAPHENSNDWTHGNFVPTFAGSPSAAQSRPFGKFLSLMASS